MGERDYWRLLVPGTRLAVEYVTIQGQMVSFLVRLEKIKQGGEWRLSARYDTCHGRPHLDVVNEKGELVLKRWMEEMDIGRRFAGLSLTSKKTMKNITDVTRTAFQKILMRPMKTVPMPPCRNRRYFKTTVLEKDLHLQIS